MSIFARSLLVISVLAVGATMDAARADIWPEKVIWNFVPAGGGSGSNIGSQPQMGVVAESGDLYGVASTGGRKGGGVAYQRTNGNMKALYSFADPDHNDADGCGYNPSARLVVDLSGSDPKLFGTTYQGGENNGGVIFLIAKDQTSGKWECRVLWAFRKDRENLAKVGYASFGGLTSDPGAPNTFYGTAQYSRTVSDQSGVRVRTGGVVFKISKSGSTWTYEVLKEFDPNSPGEGLVPTGPLLLDGVFLYGATFFGGTHDGGVIYKLDKNTKAFTRLHKFNGDVTANGAKFGYQPAQGQLVITGGFVYGATAAGGTTDLDDPVAGDLATGGTLFRIPTAGGALKVIYNFDNQNTPELGYLPIGGLTVGPDGRLYGNTQLGGSDAGGVVFRLKRPDKTPSRDNYEMLFDFGEGDFGFRPSGPVDVSAAGNITGTTRLGGSQGGGVIFRLTPP
jgi:uncharacterized repeat protein (TIGR03803 family)